MHAHGVKSNLRRMKLTRHRPGHCSAGVIKGTRVLRAREAKLGKRWLGLGGRSQTMSDQRAPISAGPRNPTVLTSGKSLDTKNAGSSLVRGARRDLKYMAPTDRYGPRLLRFSFHRVTVQKCVRKLFNLPRTLHARIFLRVDHGVRAEACACGH